MHLERLKHSNCEAFLQAYALYQTSFPLFEQRTLDAQQVILPEDAYHFEVIKNDMGALLGLVLSWKTDAFLYIEHFAILESARGQTIGSQVLENLRSNQNCPIILEIDPPIDAISIRRQGFYERLGFQLSEFDHRHPPYRTHSMAHSLKIMSTCKMSDALYDAFNTYLLNRVMHDCAQ